MEGENADVEAFDYTANSRCNAVFSALKEQCLDLFRNRHCGDQSERVNRIRFELEQAWQNLPAHFRLATALKECPGRPFVRDFLLNTRLDYLHTHFLLGLASLQTMSEPDETLLIVACETLSLVVEAILLRNKLVNSGSCLIWKVSVCYAWGKFITISVRRAECLQVAQFGLPAAGIICLALLSSSNASHYPSLSRSKMIQNLCVLVAEVKTGAVISPEEPNFALFTRATQTIQSLLDSSLMWSPTAARPIDAQRNTNLEHTADWDPGINFDPWEFELDFWENLAGHPSLTRSSPSLAPHPTFPTLT